MRNANRLVRLAGACLAALSIALVAPARADEAPAQPVGRVGVGWRAGNGLGFLGGDVVVLAAPRVAVELQLSYAHDSQLEQTAYGIAPAVRGYLRPEGPSFYVVAGAPLVWKSAADVFPDSVFLGRLTWFRPGLFLNVGHEWRWPSGLGLLVGAGIGWAPAVTVSTGAGSFVDQGYLGGNMELGVRYMFR